MMSFSGTRSDPDVRHIQRLASQFSTTFDGHFLISVVNIDHNDEKRGQNGQNNVQPGKAGHVTHRNVVITWTDIVVLDHSDNRHGPKWQQSLKDYFRYQ